MFAINNRFFVVAAAVLLCAALALADEHILVADFVETRPDRAYSTMSGKLYYFYDSSNANQCRLRFDYSIPNNDGNKPNGDYYPSNGLFSDLYDYNEHAMYSMCDQCSTIALNEFAVPWSTQYGTYWKSGEQENGCYWWYHNEVKDNNVYVNQVKRILLENNNNHWKNIKRIEFTDGRVLVISNIQYNPNNIKKGNAKFDINQGLDCPAVSCKLYADIVFVVDNSMSVETKWENGVRTDDWGDQINFVKKVMGLFEFGDDAVEAAVVQFNAPWPKNDCNYGRCNRCTNDKDFGNPNVPSENTATMIAAIDGTVSSDKSRLESALNGERPGAGWTCQAYGLELAKQIFDRSPRRNLRNKPNKIVIAVTDGEDFCPRRTETAAKALRDDGVFLIEVGVGIGSFLSGDEDCKGFDMGYLASIASKIGGSDSPAIFSAESYQTISTIVDQLFKPLCSSFNTACGPDCLGFCGCGKCFCPTCNSPSSCKSIDCRVQVEGNVSKSRGCELSDISCSGTNDRCTQHVCVEGSGCTEQHTDCSSMNRGCRKGKCDPSGGCKVDFDDDYCQDQHGKNDKCKIYKCARDGENVDFSWTGCRLIEDKAQNHQQSLNSQGKHCMKAVCDKSSGNVREEDGCSNSQNPGCYINQCVKDGNNYNCKPREYNRPANTACLEYECKNNKWEVSVNRDDWNWCMNNELKGQDTKCKNIRCNSQQKKCELVQRPNCQTECSGEQYNDCVKQVSAGNNDPKQCKLPGCTYNGDKHSCFFSQTIDCTQDQDMQEQLFLANQDNTDGTVCYVAACKDSSCAVVPVHVQDSGIPQTLCSAPQCVFNEQTRVWGWEARPTPLAQDCVNFGDCYTASCNDTEGCVKDFVCEHKSKGCVKYSCNNDGSCIKSIDDLSASETECTKEVCNEETGETEFAVKDLNKACPAPNPCKLATCVDGKCVFVDKEPEEKDDCYNYTCDPTTGNFTSIPKCDDHLYCTENKCTVFGECKYEPISCGKEIDLEGYPCFEARCKENATAKTYQCQRKLIRNAYVDICGNCIIEDRGTTSSSKSETDMLECTGAPAKPVLTEGLAAAAIALIVIGAVVLGAAIAASSVLGAKTLIERSKDAGNQSAHSNPLYENNDTEMTNPAYQENQTV